MIEKLDPIKHTDNLYDKNGFITNVACGGVVIRKINELIDAVNQMQESQNTYWTDIAEIKKELQTRAENVQTDVESRPVNVQDRMIGCTTLEIPKSYKNDPFAEQRRWIGKLCRAFDDDETTATVFGILEKIHGPTNPYLVNGAFYEYCEPVKPDDSIIYKGE